MDGLDSHAFRRGFSGWKASFRGWGFLVPVLVAGGTLGLKVYSVFSLPEPALTESLRSAWIDFGVIPAVVGVGYLLASLAWCCVTAAPKQRDEALRRVAELEERAAALERARSEARSDLVAALDEARKRADHACAQLARFEHLERQAVLLQSTVNDIADRLPRRGAREVPSPQVARDTSAASPQQP